MLLALLVTFVNTLPYFCKFEPLLSYFRYLISRIINMSAFCIYYVKNEKAG